MDSAPIIYFLEGHPKFAPVFRPFFEEHDAGRLRFAVTTATLAEVLSGPLKAGDEALAERYPHRRRRDRHPRPRFLPGPLTPSAAVA
jgi:hypothetical protein